MYIYIYIYVYSYGCRADGAVSPGEASGDLGSGTGILLAVTIIYQYFEIAPGPVVRNAG